jgi:hypothetical protein
MKVTPVITAVPEPSVEDLDGIIRELKSSWKSAITIRRQCKDDCGYREIFVSLNGEFVGYLSHGDAITREIAPGSHRLQAHNTLFRKQIDVTLQVGEHASFTTANREGFGTYSIWAFLIGFLGAGPLYLTLEREGAPDPGTPSGS